MIDISKIELRKSYVIFQDKAYKGWGIIWNYFEFSDESGKREIFPGIYIESHEIRGIKRIVYKLQKREVIYYKIDNCNQRDRFEILAEISEKHEKCTSNLEVSKLDIKKVEFPNNLGGGECGGCPVVSCFSKITLSPSYHIISESEVLEETQSEPFFSEMCEKSRCYLTYLKIKENGFDKDLPERKMIYID